MNQAAEQTLHALKNMLKHGTVGDHSDLLTIRTSGDRIELSTKTAFRQNPEQYRKAVIRAGQFLQAIDVQSYLTGEQILIQSFPGFEDDRLIATVRLLAKSSTDDEPPDPYDNITETSVIRVLKSVASHHGLFFPDPAEQQSVKNLRLSIPITELTALRENDLCFCLGSATDNPFIWLKTGQWIEETRTAADGNNQITTPLIFPNIPKEDRTLLGTLFEDCGYCQALVIYSKPGK